MNVFFYSVNCELYCTKVKGKIRQEWTLNIRAEVLLSSSGRRQRQSSRRWRCRALCSLGKAQVQQCFTFKYG